LGGFYSLNNMTSWYRGLGEPVLVLNAIAVAIESLRV